jgi:DNA polymerase III delta subunit
MPVYLITGNDESTIANEAKKLVQKVSGADADAFALEIYKENEEQAPAQVLADVIASVMTPSMFGGAKTVWLQNFMAFTETSVAEPVLTNAKRLAEIIAADFPTDVTLVINGPGINQKQLLGACKSTGTVQTLKRPEISDRGWKRDVAGLVDKACTERGMKLQRDAIDYLLEVIGVQTGRVENEIEKIFCYAGAEPSLQEVQAVCTGNREAAYFALNNAFGDRDLAGAYAAITQVMANHKNPESIAIGLIRQASRLFEQLLQARVLMQSLKVENPKQLAGVVARMDAAEKSRFKAYPLLGKSDWLIGKVAVQAKQYTGPELVQALSLLAEADRYNVSSALPRRLVLEALALRVISPAK